MADRASELTLAQWRDRARAFRAEPIHGRTPRSAADLVIADRSERRRRLADLDRVATPEEALA